MKKLDNINKQTTQNLQTIFDQFENKLKKGGKSNAHTQKIQIRSSSQNH